MGQEKTLEVELPESLKLQIPIDSIPSQITQLLIRQLLDRDSKGLKKYGTSLDRTDLNLEEWLQHQLEELLDGAGYAAAAMREFQAMRAEMAKLRTAAQELALLRKTVDDTLARVERRKYYEGADVQRGERIVLDAMKEALWKFDLQAILRQVQS